MKRQGRGRMRRNVARAVLVVGMVTAGMLARSPLAAQEPPRQEADPFAAVLFPPELIMQHARAIRLSDDQRRAITAQIGQVQKRVIGLQWQLAEQVPSSRIARPRQVYIGELEHDYVPIDKRDGAKR